MISQTAEYALRAIVCLAEHNDTVATLQQIAVATKVPSGYLSKVLQGLVRSGLVISQRGPAGGFTLARPAGELTIYEIVQAVDPVARILKCPLGLPAHADHLCPLHRRLDDAAALIEKSFRDATIADLLTGPNFANSSA